MRWLVAIPVPWKIAAPLQCGRRSEWRTYSPVAIENRVMGQFS
jgi:hypothetical protein